MMEKRQADDDPYGIDARDRRIHKLEKALREIRECESKLAVECNRYGIALQGLINAVNRALRK